LGLTYDAAREADTERALMRDLLKALDGSNRALRLDECGAWRITGKRGHSYTCMEGCLRLLARPTPKQAALIRGAIGLRRRRRYATNTITPDLIRSAPRRGVSARPLSEDIVAGAIGYPEAIAQKHRGTTRRKPRLARIGRRWSQPQNRNLAGWRITRAKVFSRKA
jgi:hypothetical protein